MPAMTTQQRSAKAAAKRQAKGEEELRLRVRPGTKAALAELMAWHGFDEQAEALTLLIHNTHALGRDGSTVALSVPRHEITVTESVAQQLAAFVPEDEEP
jgi:hypothetical protein